MIDRRELLLGLGCAGALATSEALRPRRQVILMPRGSKLADIIPSTFPGWTVGGEGEVVVPRTEGSLQSRLYSDELVRNYRPIRSDSSFLPVMLMAAYGSNQSDALQLHRPEVCYPASGFAVSNPRAIELRISGAVIPAVALTATYRERVEDILYWTRLGDALPRSEGEQRKARLSAAMRGMIGDGVLIRASIIRTEPTKTGFSQLERFLADMILNISATSRFVLLGGVSRNI